MRVRLVILSAFFAACSTAPPAQGPRPEAQPPAPAAQADPAPQLPGTLAASARVAAIEIVPSPIEVTRGDTVTFQGILRDAAGEQVRGARWGVLPVPSVFEVRSIKDSTPDTYRLWGVAPGEVEMGTALVVPTDTGISFRPMSPVRVRVKEWPAARIEIDPPAYAPYANTAFALSGRVLTVKGTEHSTATIAWSSGNPEVASINRDGVVTFRKPGRAQMQAAAEGITAVREIEVRPDPVAAVTLEPARTEARTGDVVQLAARVTDRRGRALGDLHVAYSVSAVEGPQGGAVVYGDGAFVAEKPGVYRVLATAGQRTASAVISASARPGRRPTKLIGRGTVAHVTTSDLWVFEGRDGRDYAYTGTHAEGGGQRMFAWDVTDPANPVLTDSVVVDARVVNDVKVNEAATVAVITREGASNRRNGIVILDIREPAHPRILSQFTDSLTGGVHNTWIYGDLVYAVHNGTAAMHIIDIADPANPKHVGRWEVRPGDENKYLHDVWARDGFAYLSYWDDGLIILDVGAGIKGGTPREPKFVSQYKYPIGNTHTAYRYNDYVFVGDEIFGCSECINGPRGYVHVVDVRDIENPKEVARYEVPEAGVHNVWVEDDRLYAAYYQGGLRVVDVSGDLRGDLYAQGREIGWVHSAAKAGEAIHPNSPMAWGPQPHKGYIFFSDMHSGLWVVQMEPSSEPLVP